MNKKLNINVRTFVKSLVAYFGYSFIKNSDKKLFLEILSIKSVIDVGANEGQYAMSLRSQGYRGQIYSFEPLTTAHRKLMNNSMSDANWFVHKPVACGARKGKKLIYVAGNSASSSIRKMLRSHIESAPNTITIGTQDVNIITLDSQIERWRKMHNPILLKIDTQGFEYEVLKGAEQTLKLVTGVLIELSVIELYKNQKLYDYFLEYFSAREFILFDIFPGFSNPKTTQLLQFDALFVRKSTVRKLSSNDFS
jgi:FkbM family methyltransferase